MSTRVIRTSWEYRTLNLGGAELQVALNEAGAAGFQVIYANYSHQQAAGVCFVLMGREVEIEEQRPVISH
jgi:hypothetical protein